MVKCTECDILITEETGRYNYPSGVLCTQCGEIINNIVEEAERLIKVYNRCTGYNIKVSVI